MEQTLIDMKFELEFEIEKAQKELRNLPNVHELQRTAQQKRTHHRLAVERSEHPHGMLIPNIREEVKERDQEAEDAERIAAEAAGIKRQLMEKIADLEKRLAAIEIHADLKDVLVIQSRKAGIENLIAEIKKTIGQEEQKIESVEIDSTHPLSVLTAKRDAMLADVALGKKVSNKEMASISEKIADEEKRHSDLVTSVTNTKNGINGLKTKLAELEQELLRVEKYHTEMIIAFLSQEIQISAQEYASLATKLSDVFMDIATLEQIIEGYGSSVKALSESAHRFTIPTLNFPSCQPSDEMKGAGCLFSYLEADRHRKLQDVLKSYTDKGLFISKGN